MSLAGTASQQVEHVLVEALVGDLGGQRAGEVAAAAGRRLIESGLNAGHGPHADALSEIATGCRAAYEFPDQRFRLRGDMARILCDHLAPERAGQYERPPTPDAEFDAYVQRSGGGA